jgi:hypothetical protein
MHLALSDLSIRRKRHESVMSLVKGKFGVPIQERSPE